MSENVDRARLLHEKIREILLREWDPIGVRDLPEAQDEYDAYVSSVYKLLTAGKSVHEILDYLLWVETEHMGLSADRQHTEAVARKLRALLG